MTKYTYDRSNSKRLVFIDGFGLTLNKFFCDRHGIEEGADIHPSVLKKHAEEVPIENR